MPDGGDYQNGRRDEAIKAIQNELELIQRNQNVMREDVKAILEAVGELRGTSAKWGGITGTIGAAIVFAAREIIHQMTGKP